MKAFRVPFFLWILAFFPLMPASLQKAPQKTIPLLANKIYVNYLCMNKWENGIVENSAMVILKESAGSGAVISNAKVAVNGFKLSYNAGIQTYMGPISSLMPGQKVKINIRTKDGREISGHVVATYFVRIIDPAPFSFIPYAGIFPVSWEFSDHGSYMVVLKILRGETQLHSSDVMGNSTNLNFKLIGLKLLKGEKINIRVISPWTSVCHFIGPASSDSRADFFASATVTINID